MMPSTLVTTTSSSPFLNSSTTTSMKSFINNDDNHRSTTALTSILVEGVDSASCSSSRTLVLTLPTDSITLDLLHDEISSQLNVDRDEFLLFSSSKLLHSSHLGSLDASFPLILRYLPRNTLVGGKGGFGSLLRSATTKVGAKKTSNFSAMRDLSGRRMRHVEAEQKIAEWNATHHEDVKPADLAAKYKAIKEGRPTEAQQCKWGLDCKYRYTSCRREHPPDPNAINDKDDNLTMPSHIGRTAELPKPVSKKEMQNSVLSGLQLSRKRMRAAAAADGEESKEGGDEQDNDEDQDYYTSSSEDEEDDGQEERKERDLGDGAEKHPKRVHLDPETSSGRAYAAASSSAAAASSSSSWHPAAAASSSSSHLSSFPSASHRPSELASLEPAQAALGLAAVLAQVKQKKQQEKVKEIYEAPPTVSAAAASSTPAAAASSSSSSSAATFDPIDLNSIDSVDALASCSAAHLGAELTRVGLKCGGTKTQRAERLWMLKGTTIDKLPAKVRAAH